MLIVDDHDVTRRGIRSLLADEAGLEICGEAEDGYEAVAKAAELRPDLVILDLTMPKQGGFTVIKELQRAELPSKILVFSTHSYPHLEATLRSAGCDGYVAKGNATEDLVKAIRAVLAGRKFFRSQGGRPTPGSIDSLSCR